MVTTSQIEELARRIGCEFDAERVVLFGSHARGVDFAVTFRYPGESADRESAFDARRRCRSFRCAARHALGLGA